MEKCAMVLKNHSSMTKKQSFSSLMLQFEHRYDLRTAFDDFLTLSLCSLSINPLTRKSYDEDLYIDTIRKYEKDDMRHIFAKAFAQMIQEMEERKGSSQGNDIVGDFYQEHLYRKGASQYFTPWHVCEMMAKITCAEETEKVLNVLDPTCGSGRMLLASAFTLGNKHRYYGIDIDMTCIMMSAINLFLNGVFRGEVMCADALNPDDFRGSYKFSMFPLGVRLITEKENSTLWHLHKNSFVKDEMQTGTQIRLF
jgi:type I restriction-modification system DNA methylase subunit